MVTIFSVYDCMNATRPNVNNYFISSLRYIFTSIFFFFFQLLNASLTLKNGRKVFVPDICTVAVLFIINKYYFFFKKKYCFFFPL